jgi:cell division protease FtsH
VIFREDLEEIFGKRAWDPELTENLLPIQFLKREPEEQILTKEKEGESEIQAPESPTQL